MSNVKIPEPVAWISTVQCIGAINYGKDRYGRLPVQSLQQGYYSHTPLITTEQAEAYAQAVRDEAVKRARPIYFSDGYQAGWNSALEQAMKVIESISVPAGNSAAGELAFLRTMDNMREARDAIRALKRGQS